MHRFAALALFLAGLAPAQNEKLARQFVGAWRLVSIEGTSRVTPMAYDRPTGIIMYDSSGRMSVQISRRADRRPFAGGINSGTPEEKAAAFDSYTAYYGAYTVDAKAGTVTHHLEDRLGPGGRGVDNVRYFEFRGDRVVLMPVEDGKGGRIARKDATYKLTWERIK
jgi:hypothetical protein